MAYVNVPRDLSKYESKVAFNLTKRQLICFLIGAAFAIPAYWFTRHFLPSDVRSILMFIIASPFFVAGIFKKDGMTLEKYLYIVCRQKYFRPGIRRYKTLTQSKREVTTKIKGKTKKKKKR